MSGASVFARTSGGRAFVAAVLASIALISVPDAFAGVPSVAWQVKANAQSAAVMSAPNGMAVDKAGNIYVIADVLGSPLTVKYDPSGVEQWRVQEADGAPVSLALDDAANVYLAAIVDGPTLGTHAFLTIKYDTNGVKQWQTESNDADGRDAVTMAISVDKSGDVYTSGQSRTLTADPWAFLTVKLDANGVEQWRALAIASDSANAGFPIVQAVDGAGNLSVTGTVGSYDCLTINYGPSGNERWRGSCNNTLTIWASPTAIATDDVGNVYLTAQSAYLTSAGLLQTQFLTIKYGASGIEQWRQEIPVGSGIFGTKYEDPFAVAIDASGNVYVAGRIWDTYINQSRSMTVQYSPSGVMQWTRFGDYLPRIDDYPQSVVVDPDGNVYIAMPSYDLDTGESNRLIVKYGSDGSSLWTFTTPGAVAPGYPFVLAFAPSGGLYTATQSADPADPSGVAVQDIVESPTSLASTPNPSSIGQSVTLTATVGNQTPAGSVVFREGDLAVLGCFTTVPVTSGTASCTTASLTPGTHSIAAIYSDDDGSINAWTYLTQVVTAPPTTTTLTSSRNPSNAGDAVIFTASISGNVPTGTVDFRDGAATICAGVSVRSLGKHLGQGATCITAGLASGIHQIAATYSGDAKNTGSNSNIILQTVAGGNPTATTLTSSLNPSHVGNSVTFNATVTGGVSPSGAIAFMDGKQAIAGCVSVALNAGQASCSTSTLTKGKHTMTAAYSGDVNNAASTSHAVKQTVKP